jgi:hypothetical protein
MTSAGMMATLIALIIGLLVTSAKGNYDNTTSGITQSGAKIITLDYYLSNCPASTILAGLTTITLAGFS